MKKLVLVLALVIAFITADRVQAADYKMGNPSVVTVVTGNIPVSSTFKVNLTILHLWAGIGTGAPSTLYSYVFFPIDLGGVTVSPGVGIVNNFPSPDKFAGTLAISMFGKVGPFKHFTEGDVYLSPGQVNVWATTRWLMQPIEGVPLNIGAQAYMFNTSVNVGPEASYSLPHVDIGVQYLFGIVNNNTHSVRGVVRSWF